jgi:hypothetical protein
MSMATLRKASDETAVEDNVDALELLTADHDDVRELFEQYEDLVNAEADGDDKQLLAERICALLILHATIEEEIFYPAARDALDEQHLLDEAEVEHASAKTLIAQIQDMDPDEQLYDATVKVLGEYVQHHVREEEDALFPMLMETDIDLDALGEELAVRKDELLAELGTNAEF